MVAVFLHNRLDTTRNFENINKEFQETGFEHDKEKDFWHIKFERLYSESSRVGSISSYSPFKLLIAWSFFAFEFSNLNLFESTKKIELLQCYLENKAKNYV